MLLLLLCYIHDGLRSADSGLVRQLLVGQDVLFFLDPLSFFSFSFQIFLGFLLDATREHLLFERVEGDSRLFVE